MNLKFRTILILIVTLLFNVTENTLAQSVHPSVKSLNDSTWKYIYKNPKTAKSWGKKSVLKAQEINDKYSIGAATTRYAIAYDLAGEYEEALKLYLESLSILKEFKPSEELGFLYNNLSLCYYNFYDYNHALLYVRQAYKNDKALQDSSGMASALTNMGLFYGYLNQPDSSLLVYDQSIAISKRIGDTVNYQSATSNKAKIIFQQGKYQEAIRIYKSLRPIIQSEIAKISWYISISQSYNKLNKSEIALSYADSALQLAKYNHIKERTLYALENYSEIASNSGKTQEALEKYRSYIALKDSIFKSEMDERIANQESRFKVLEKEKETAKAKSQTLEEQVQKETFYQYLLISVSVLIVVILIVVLLIIFLRSQRKTNRLTEEKIKQKELFMHEIHHRVKNNMQMISAMIDIQQATSEEKNEPFLDQLKERLITMAKTHQFLYENHDFQGIKLDDYFEELKDLFQNSTDDIITFDFNIESLILHVDTVIPISLIISEWVTNSIKHAFKDTKNGKIQLDIHLNNNILHIKYSDSGIGISDNNEGFGSNMIRSLSRQLKGKISVDSSSGTSYHLEIKRFKIIEED